MGFISIQIISQENDRYHIKIFELKFLSIERNSFEWFSLNTIRESL